MSEFDLKTTSIHAGLSVIEASAGTGKTWTIAHLLPRLLIQGQLQSLSEAVLVTFTEDAARELSEKVRRAVVEVAEAVAGKRALGPGPEDFGKRVLKELYEELEGEPKRLAGLRLQNAMEESGQLSVSTIHAFCKRVLGQEAFLCGMPPGFQLLADSSELEEEVLRDLWRSRLAADPLLTAVAASQGWTLEQDRKAWRLLEPLPDRPLHPKPLGLEDAKAALVRALQKMKAQREGLQAVQAGLDQGLGTNQAAKPERLGPWRQALEALQPQAPSAVLLAGLDELTELPGWFRKQGKGKEKVAELAGSALVQAAEEAQAALSRLHWAWTGFLAEELALRMASRLRQDHAATYHSLIEQLHRALHAEGRGDELARRLRKVWKLCLLDESQDTDPLQLAIFEKIFNRSERGTELISRLVLIGDPKQAIYGFRGADLRAYQQAASAASSNARKTLLKTYRSAPGLVSALNALWGRLGAPLGDPELRVDPASSAQEDQKLALPQDGQGRLVFSVVGAEDIDLWKRAPKRLEASAKAAAAAIRSSLGLAMGEATAAPGDCCVLVRSNHEAKAVAEQLRALKIPCVLRDDADVLLSEEAEDLRRVLHACLQPQRRALRRGALATRVLGLDAAALRAMDEGTDELWRARLARLGERWQDRGLAALLADLEQGWPQEAPHQPGALAQLAQEPDAERRLTDWRHVAELLQAQEAQGTRQPEALLHWLEAAQAGARERTASDERTRRLEADGSAVQILTMHRAKGLEFELVYCPFLWAVPGAAKSADARRLVRQGAIRALCEPAQLDKGPQAELSRREDWERLQEDLRLAYVALTRAKRRAWVLVGLAGCSEDSRSVQGASALDWLLRDGEVADAPAWCEAEKKAKQAKDLHAREEALRKVLAALQASAEVLSPGCVSVVEAALEAEAWTAGPAQPHDLSTRECGRPVLGTWRLSSYSSLISAHSEGAVRERRDPAAQGAEGEAGETVALAPFPAGAAIGNALHELLEAWDLQRVEDAPIQATLRAHGLDAALKDGQDPAALLAQVLPQWTQARIPALACSLGEAARLKRLSEWAFMLPLGAQGLSGEALAAAFAAHARTPQEEAYAQSLKALPSATVHGFLHGFIDRLAVHQGRWAVLDWKSNQLGPHAGDYAPERLWQAACEHHYLLQLHLYMVALRRHLRLRDPQAAVAGAGLVFLRGLQAGSPRGLLWVDPSAALLDALEGLFQWEGRP